MTRKSRETVTVVQWVPHANLTHDERMAKVEQGHHHDYWASLVQVIPASDIEEKWGK